MQQASAERRPCAQHTGQHGAPTIIFIIVIFTANFSYVGSIKTSLIHDYAPQ